MDTSRVGLMDEKSLVRMFHTRRVALANRLCRPATGRAERGGRSHDFQARLPTLCRRSSGRRVADRNRLPMHRDSTHSPSCGYEICGLVVASAVWVMAQAAAL